MTQRRNDSRTFLTTNRYRRRARCARVVSRAAKASRPPGVARFTRCRPAPRPVPVPGIPAATLETLLKSNKFIHPHLAFVLLSILMLPLAIR
jgi:hypothetical protein